MNQSNYSELQQEVDGRISLVDAKYGIAQWEGAEVTIAVIDSKRWAQLSDVAKPLFGRDFKPDCLWRLFTKSDRPLLDGFMFIAVDRVMFAMTGYCKDLNEVVIDFSDNALESNALLEIAGLD